MDAEEALEVAGVALELRQGEVAEARGGVHEEHGAAHEVGEALNGSVSLLVGGEIAVAESFGEDERLAEAEAETFAGDGVDGARGVANQGDVAASDTMELAAESEGAARGVSGSGRLEALTEFREVSQGALDAGEFCGGDEGYADLVL